ncbi:MAG: hypothetical protein KKC75_05060 [Nanoarchaeota archaeon]|nr:hypothetical protein [Nanoarchaeota archaeon]MBU1004823.1 hypothetical protein [Nanoarchaeota archaeon]MBU1946761.1 hypothetical protein [Nanoarchaeota archaeon]
MEMNKLSIKDEIKMVARDETRLSSELHPELFHEMSVNGEEPRLGNIPEDKEHVMLNLRPDEMFNNLEEEYNKVKDFDFSKVDVKEIRKHIKTL